MLHMESKTQNHSQYQTRHVLCQLIYTLAVACVCWGLLVGVGMACRGRVYMAPRNWSAMRPASRSPLRSAPWTVAG